MPDVSTKILSALRSYNGISIFANQALARGTNPVKNIPRMKILQTAENLAHE